MKKTPFRLTPYQVQFLLIVGFVTVGYALYLRYLAVEFSTVALACDAGLQSLLCKSQNKQPDRQTGQADIVEHDAKSGRYQSAGEQHDRRP